MVNASIRDEAGFQQHLTTSTASRDNTAQSHIHACGTSQMLFPRVFDIILTNDFLHWHEGIKVSQTSKESSRTWNYHSHRMLGEVLQTLYKMAGRERSSWIIGYLKNDLHGFSRRDECELLTYYLNKSIRKLHSNFRMDQLNMPSALFPLDNIIVMEGMSRLRILEDSECHRFPNRIAFARNLAFLAYSQTQQYHGIDFDSSNHIPHGSVPVLSSIVKRSLVELVGEMIPFTDEKFVDFCRKYFLLSRAHCASMGPVMIKKTFIMNPLMDFATTAAPSSNRDPSNNQATVHLPRDLEEIIHPHPASFQFISDFVNTAFGRYDDRRPWAQQQHPQQQRYYVVDDDEHNNAFLRRYFLQQRDQQQERDTNDLLTKQIAHLVAAGLLLLGLIRFIGYDKFNDVVVAMLDQYPAFAAAWLGATSACSIWILFEVTVIRSQVMYSILGVAFILYSWCLITRLSAAASADS